MTTKYESMSTEKLHAKLKGLRTSWDNAEKQEKKDKIMKRIKLVRELIKTRTPPAAPSDEGQEDPKTGQKRLAGSDDASDKARSSKKARREAKARSPSPPPAPAPMDTDSERENEDDGEAREAREDPKPAEKRPVSSDPMVEAFHDRVAKQGLREERTRSVPVRKASENVTGDLSARVRASAKALVKKAGERALEERRKKHPKKDEEGNIVPYASKKRTLLNGKEFFTKKQLDIVNDFDKLVECQVGKTTSSNPEDPDAVRLCMERAKLEKLVREVLDQELKAAREKFPGIPHPEEVRMQEGAIYCLMMQSEAELTKFLGKVARDAEIHAESDAQEDNLRALVKSDPDNYKSDGTHDSFDPAEIQREKNRHEVRNTPSGRTFADMMKVMPSLGDVRVAMAYFQDDIDMRKVMAQPHMTVPRCAEDEKLTEKWIDFCKDTLQIVEPGEAAKKEKNERKKRTAAKKAEAKAAADAEIEQHAQGDEDEDEEMEDAEQES